MTDIRDMERIAGSVVQWEILLNTATNPSILNKNSLDFILFYIHMFKQTPNLPPREKKNHISLIPIFKWNPTIIFTAALKKEKKKKKQSCKLRKYINNASTHMHTQLPPGLPPTDTIRKGKQNQLHGTGPMDRQTHTEAAHWCLFPCVATMMKYSAENNPRHLERGGNGLRFWPKSFGMRPKLHLHNPVSCHTWQYTQTQQRKSFIFNELH